MPVQQQMSSFAAKLGGRVAQANAEFRDKPPDVRAQRLPPGIRDGVAKLSTMYTKTQEADDGACPKGEVFFRASAIVVHPTDHNGIKVAGAVTQQIIPLCDLPAKVRDGKKVKDAVPFATNWNKFRSLMEILGVAKFPEPPIDYNRDPNGAIAQGARIEAYFFAAMKGLTDPARARTNPVYISFSTRGWTPPATPSQPKPEEIVFEEWHGLADPSKWNGQVVHDPAAGVQDGTAGTAPPAQPFNEFAPSPQAAPPAPKPTDPVDAVAALVETAMNDPEGATTEGADASAKLEEMAWAAGWTKQQTAGATDWGQVGDMALNKPTAPPAQPAPGPTPTASPSIGSKARFCKRTKDGEKLKNNKGEPFPAQEVEVVAVDDTAKTCTLKTVKDGKPVVDIRTKQPVAVKWEWLEQ